MRLPIKQLWRKARSRACCAPGKRIFSGAAGGGSVRPARPPRRPRGIADPDRLARLLDALYDVSSWDELLATP